jgi:hypothetical protein
MLLGIIAYAVYQYIRTPLLLNPIEVVERLRTGSIEQPTLELMALMLPIMFLTILVILAVLVILIYASISNEKKYLEIIEACKNPTPMK